MMFPKIAEMSLSHLIDKFTYKLAEVMGRTGDLRYPHR
jgi:hypothetical protein